MEGAREREREREREEVMLLHEIDKIIEIQILTPCGEEVIRINKVVKQGTIFGPILCCSNTAKIDGMGVQWKPFSVHDYQ